MKEVVGVRVGEGGDILFLVGLELVVVARSFFGIGEYFVCFSDLSEFFLRVFFVGGVFIRVPFDS